MILEFAITDFCNLQCKLCAQGTQFQKNKKHMKFEYLKEVSKYFNHHEFETIKISGGEPTLHPQFDIICKHLRELFPANTYELATNGFLLKNYLNEIKTFNSIHLSNYPGFNDNLYKELCSLNLSNLKPEIKGSYALMDIYKERPQSFNNCGVPRRIFKVVQDRIYPCCIIFGLSNIRTGIDLDLIGVNLDENWRVNLKKLNIQSYCNKCFNVWSN